MDISKAYPNPVNRDLLFEQLNASFPSLSFSDSGIVVHNISAQDEAAINGILAAHMASVLTDNQKAELARQAALEDARDYLKKQLVNPNPNVSTIYTTVKAFVDNRPQLLQMVTNNLNLCRAAFVWGALDLATPLGQQRYLMVVQITIGILA